MQCLHIKIVLLYESGNLTHKESEAFQKVYQKAVKPLNLEVRCIDLLNNPIFDSLFEVF
jgi:hypothetical protein